MTGDAQFTFSMAVSRLYLQVHFPSDMIAGILVSLIGSGIAQFFLKSGGEL